MFWAEFFGFVTAVLGVMQAWPQARKIRVLGHGHGVSITMWILMTGQVRHGSVMEFASVRRRSLQAPLHQQ